MSGIRSAAAAGVPLVTFIAWCFLYLPSSWAFHHDPIQLTHPLWSVVDNILIVLEPLSRDLPGWALSGLGPLVLLAFCLPLVAIKQRLAAYLVLVGTGIGGISPFRYLVPTIRDQLHSYMPLSRDPFANMAIAAPLDTAAQIIAALPRSVYSLGGEFAGSIAVGVTALTAAVAFRRPLFIEPWRQWQIERSLPPAKWMDDKTVRQLRAPGLILGRKGRRICTYPFSNSLFYGGHHFAISGTRGGKGVSVIIPGIVDHHGPVSCVDIKGENWLICRRAREAKGYRVKALNPWSLFEANQVGMNPFDFINPDAVSDGAKLLATALIREETNEVGAHLVDLARKLLAAAIEVVYTLDEPENRHLLTVYNLLNQPDIKTTFAAWAENPGLCAGRPARAVGPFLGKEEKEFNLVRSTINRNLSFLDSDKMQAFITTSGLKPADILDGNTDLFVVVPLEHLEDQANFLRMVTALQINTVVTSPSRRLARPLLMVLDEFPALGAMAQMKNLFTVGAGSNLIVLGITQDLARLQDVWGRDAALSMLAQCASLRIFGLGVGDTATAEWAERLLPKMVVKRENRSYRDDSVLSDQVSYSDNQQPLISAQDILRLGMTSMLCFIRGHNPVLLDRIISYEDRAYRNRIDPTPYRKSMG